jgi:mannosyltransferase OCH1-like enzyme
MIPKLFHHTWPSGGDIPHAFQIYIDTFKQLHPGYNFMLWKCDDVDQYALSDLSRRFQSGGDLHWVVKSDIMRHEILYKFGGIYLDTDMECLKNFDDLLKYDSFVGASYAPNTVSQGVIGTVPENPLFKEIAEKVISNILHNGIDSTNRRPAAITGPSCSEPFLKKVQYICPRDYFYPFPWNKLPIVRSHEELKSKFPNSYAAHWWTGITNKDGWTKQVKQLQQVRR